MRLPPRSVAPGTLRTLRASLLALACASPIAASAAPPDGGAPRRVDLFPRTLSRTDTLDAPPKPAPDTAAALAADAQGRERVRSGMVPPDWRGAERVMSARFKPTLSSVAKGSAPRALVSQALSNGPGQTAPARGDLAPSTSGEADHKYGAIELDDQVEAAHRAIRRGRDGREAVVEVELGEGGALAEARVVVPSGSSSFDQAALDAVSAGITNQPVTAHQGMRMARFRFAAARAVTPLDLAPAGSPASRNRVRGLVPKVRIQFDEVQGKVEAERPYGETLQSEVRLVWLGPARAR